MHLFHERLDGYHETNALHDGCHECEEISKMGLRVFERLDELNRAKLVAAYDYAILNGEFPPSTSELDKKIIRFMLGFRQDWLMFQRLEIEI